MGGDYAPQEIVKGALEAVRLNPIEIVLVGDPETVEGELKKYAPSYPSASLLAWADEYRPEIMNTLEEGRCPLARVRVVPSEGKVFEDEHPVQALRRKPRASVAVATQMVKEGEADAMVSMGSTGASMACAALILGTLEGVERPCLGGPFLGLAPRTVVVDIGSNVDCRPSLLLNFAVMGCVFARNILSIDHPRVGLLSVGAEGAKGNRQVSRAYQLFKQSSLNFVGNVEGMDFFTGRADVIVCDGFVGNILLKFTEGLGASMADYLRRSLEGKLPSSDLESLASRVWEMNNLPKKIGGPLLGVNGAVVVGHGASNAEGVVGAIDTARKCVELKLVESIRAELSAIRS